MSAQNTSSELILTNIGPDDLISRIADAVILKLEAKSITRSQEQQDRKVTVDEALMLLNVSRPTLTRWEQQGILMPTRLGRRIYYLYSDIVNAGNRIKIA